MTCERELVNRGKISASYSKAPARRTDRVAGVFDHVLSFKCVRKDSLWGLSGQYMHASWICVGIRGHLGSP